MLSSATSGGYSNVSRTYRAPVLKTAHLSSAISGGYSNVSRTYFPFNILFLLIFSFLSFSLCLNLFTDYRKEYDDVFDLEQINAKSKLAASPLHSLPFALIKQCRRTGTVGWVKPFEMDKGGADEK